MKKTAVLISIFVLALTFFAAADVGLRTRLADKPAYRPDEVVVKLARGGEKEARELAARHGLKWVKMLALPGYCLLRTNDGRDPAALATGLAGDAMMSSAQPNHYYFPLACPQPPYGGDYEKQWYLKVIRAPAAWEQQVCGEGVVVAIVDTGALLTHADLVGCLWENSAEKGGIPGVDDDGNGYADDENGYDFANQDGDPVDAPQPFDEDCGGHGTMVAAIVAGKDDNNPGVIGVAPEAKLMILKVMEYDPSYEGGKCIGTDVAIAAAIKYAADMGADIINLSLGTVVRSDIQEDAVEYAREAGVLLVAASGNYGDQVFFQGDLLYPAAYAQVMAVGATTRGDERAFYSQYGNNLDIVAPGGRGDEILGLGEETDIFGAAFDGTSYQVAAGTSFASPMVAGAAALLISAGLGPAERVESRLKGTAVDIGSKTGWDIHTGFGRLDCLAALQDSPTGTPLPKPVNYPNPYYVDRDPYTTISFELSSPQPVELFIYDAAGDLVRQWDLPLDSLDRYNEVRWDGLNGKQDEVGSGVYFLVLKTEDGGTAMHKIAVVHGR